MHAHPQWLCAKSSNKVKVLQLLYLGFVPKREQLIGKIVCIKTSHEGIHSNENVKDWLCYLWHFCYGLVTTMWRVYYFSFLTEQQQHCLLIGNMTTYKYYLSLEKAYSPWIYNSFLKRVEWSSTVRTLATHTYTNHEDVSMKWRQSGEFRLGLTCLSACCFCYISNRRKWLVVRRGSSPSVGV